MTVTPANFRDTFPEFSDENKYPGAQVLWWINRATRMLRVEVWGDDLDDGIMLYIAHNLVLARRNMKGAASDNLGASSGPIASKGVGSVNVSYDTHAGTIDGAGAYNLTTYGVMFYQQLLMYGAGGIQLSGPDELPPPQEI